MNNTRNILSLTESQLSELLKEAGKPGYRAKQIFKQLYERLQPDFSEMTDLPKSLRQWLTANFTVGSLSVEVAQKSKDGTEKRLYRLKDGPLIEAVLMPYDDGRRTVCISSQAGCAMGCVFCATGQMGFVRNLSEAEIFEQAYLAAVACADEQSRLSNVVMMGMGEPFHNYDAALGAVRRMMNQLIIGARHITISTVGLVSAIDRFADEGLQVNLAVSLHQTEDAVRSALMPVNKRWGIDELLDACKRYQEKTNRRITFEWALISGENDDEQTAHKLAGRLKGLLAHVNLIPLNPTAGFTGAATDRSHANRFVQILGDYGISATLRVRRGLDIDAGCGQLRQRALTEEPTTR